MKNILLILSIFISTSSIGQELFTVDPLKAKFITSDIPDFWKAFDQVDTKKNPFDEYLNNGSNGLKDFIPYRIESPKNLLKIVKNRKSDYLKIRESSYKVELQIKPITSYYQELKNLYDEAIFPPTYFVIGAFNSGGTSSDNGLIIGVEMQNNIENIPYIVSHELIHFNQNYPNTKNTLLQQSIMEGSADFIGELISGKHINESAFKYGNENEKMLCSEFVEIMDGSNYHGWLYGTKGRAKGRPSDLGYWMGYKICEAYYKKSPNKEEAIHEILNIQSFHDFLKKSGCLNQYMTK